MRRRDGCQQRRHPGGADGVYGDSSTGKETPPRYKARRGQTQMITNNAHDGCCSWGDVKEPLQPQLYYWLGPWREQIVISIARRKRAPPLRRGQGRSRTRRPGDRSSHAGRPRSASIIPLETPEAQAVSRDSSPRGVQRALGSPFRRVRPLHHEAQQQWDERERQQQPHHAADKGGKHNPPSAAEPGVPVFPRVIAVHSPRHRPPPSTAVPTTVSLAFRPLASENAFPGSHRRHRRGRGPEGRRCGPSCGGAQALLPSLSEPDGWPACGSVLERAAGVSAPWPSLRCDEELPPALMAVTLDSLDFASLRRQWPSR